MEMDNRFLDFMIKIEKKLGWQFGCNDESTSELLTKFSSKVKARPIQETEDSSMCVYSWMICARHRIEPSSHSKLVLHMKAISLRRHQT